VRSSGSGDTRRVPGRHEITFGSDAVTLAGSLAMPDRRTPSPGVVMVGGSGPSDRDNDTLFPPIRRSLVAAGIAVLSYDKRGVGGSSGAWVDAGLDDLADDAVAALTFLRGWSGVEADAVGLFGHSEGGWVVLRAAAARDGVAFVVTNGCPGMTPAAQDRHALATALATAPATGPATAPATERGEGGEAAERDIDAELAIYDRLVAAGQRGADFAEATRVIETGSPGSVLAQFWAGVDEREWAFIKRKQDHDPVADAVRLRCPQLVTFGAADQLVPVAESVRLFGAAACHPDRPARSTLTVEVFPRADHRVQIEGAGLAPGYGVTVSRWILHQISTRHAGHGEDVESARGRSTRM
jgi:uncharacterized protein